LLIAQGRGVRVIEAGIIANRLPVGYPGECRLLALTQRFAEDRFGAHAICREYRDDADDFFCVNPVRSLYDKALSALIGVHRRLIQNTAALPPILPSCISRR
jgi:hypothetical protein